MNAAVWILPLLFLVREGDEDPARAALDKAEAAARAGRYSEAKSAYQRLAKKSPETEAGRVAARRSTPSSFLGWDYVVEHGPSSNRVDIVLMGDGYELESLKAFAKLAEDIPPLFERQATFREYWNYLNFMRCDLLSAESGVDGFGREYDTALNASTGDTYAGHVVIDRGRVAAMFAELPEHDDLAICYVKTGVLGTGGSGVATIGGRSATTTIHEWGHAFGLLGDEYDTAQSAHQGAPRRSANVSDTGDPKLVPWAHWLEAKHPGVGVYEGAAARVKGAWRSTTTGCTMASSERFCVVCQEQLVLRIYDYVDPIDSVVPDPQPLRNKPPIVMSAEGLTIDVHVMRPATHALEVTWWVLPEARFPTTGSGSTPGNRNKPGARDRSRRGALIPITDEPHGRPRSELDGKHRLKLTPTDLEPGKYLVVCRAKDTTKLRGEKWPWVMKDEKGVLESERSWWIQVP
jgi:tetratricopeptide (TPR) repeat protein